ncbi:hypothetical protein Y1Q_0018138 [Alligator mississippiensis]|uniref:Uncharacterized protein n=1 Tax=Alligator mississippiensis TaxID=8496 RepID=A0A151LZM1_ALLMI|nr:hypothetical protein Y1Q_0018138 [Alligator mississippiensis]
MTPSVTLESSERGSQHRSAGSYPCKQRATGKLQGSLLGLHVGSQTRPRGRMGLAPWLAWDSSLPAPAADACIKAVPVELGAAVSPRFSYKMVRMMLLNAMDTWEDTRCWEDGQHQRFAYIQLHPFYTGLP